MNTSGHPGLDDVPCTEPNAVIEPAAAEPDFNAEQQEIQRKYLLYLHEVKEMKEEKKRKKKEKFFADLNAKAEVAAPAPTPSTGDANASGTATPAQPAADEYFKPAYNTSIYVTGLPNDVTIDEMVETFSKVGVIKKHPETGELMAKLYTDESGKFKGEARVTFFKPESIELAVQVLNDTELRLGSGVRMHVEEAVFKKRADAANKGSVQGALARKKKKKKHDPTHWSLDDYADAEPDKRKLVGTMILKHMFVMEDFDDPDALENLKEEVTEEASKYGTVHKVTVYDSNPEGVVSVKYADRADAEKCISKMNGRFYAKRRIEAFLWDGKTDYNVIETEEAKKLREKRWVQYLGEQEQEHTDSGGDDDDKA